MVLVVENIGRATPGLGRKGSKGLCGRCWRPTIFSWRWMRCCWASWIFIGFVFLVLDLFWNFLFLWFFLWSFPWSVANIWVIWGICKHNLPTALDLTSDPPPETPSTMGTPQPPSPSMGTPPPPRGVVVPPRYPVVKPLPSPMPKEEEPPNEEWEEVEVEEGWWPATAHAQWRLGGLRLFEALEAFKLLSLRAGRLDFPKKNWNYFKPFQKKMDPWCYANLPNFQFMVPSTLSRLLGNFQPFKQWSDGQQTVSLVKTTMIKKKNCCQPSGLAAMGGWEHWEVSSNLYWLDLFCFGRWCCWIYSNLGGEVVDLNSLGEVSKYQDTCYQKWLLQQRMSSSFLIISHHWKIQIGHEKHQCGESIGQMTDGTQCRIWGAQPVLNSARGSKWHVVMSVLKFFEPSRPTSAVSGNSELPRRGWTTCRRMPPSQADETTWMNSWRST